MEEHPDSHPRCEEAVNCRHHNPTNRNQQIFSERIYDVTSALELIRETMLNGAIEKRQTFILGSTLWALVCGALSPLCNRAPLFCF